MRALVRYQDRLRCGLEFVSLSVEQRAAIRDWTKEAKATSEDTSLAAPVTTEKKGNEPEARMDARVRQKPPGNTAPKRRAFWWLILLTILAMGAGVWWWRWNRGWNELESGLKNPQAGTEEKPRGQVPAEVMERLLVHRVEPIYPAEARKERLEGTIALDIVIGRDGSVQNMRALNGPDVLARAAMDALRWWKFEPYRINGEPAVVETTLAVEFKR
jgi:TonB family protein